MTPLLLPGQSPPCPSCPPPDLVPPAPWGFLTNFMCLHSCSDHPCSGSNLPGAHCGETNSQSAFTHCSEARQDPLFLGSLVQGLLQISAHGLHLAFKASLHFLWLLLFPLSTYLVGFQDQPRLRLGYMEIEIDTVPLLFNLVKKIFLKKGEFLAMLVPLKPG